MTLKDKKSWESYDKNSEYYFNSYNKLYFSNVHRAFIKFLPTNRGAKVLDIGCGSGRDALALARRGYVVTAIEPSIEMLRLAMSRDNAHRVNWINDSLPEARKLENLKFEFILISAVWMHIPPEDRADTIKRVASLLELGGFVAISLRYGPSETFRSMYASSSQELMQLATENDLTPIYSGRTVKDSFQRSEIHWQKIVFQKPS